MESLFIVVIFLLSLFFFVMALLEHVWVSVVFSLIGVLGMGWAIFGNSMNLVQRIGSFYWIIRDNGKKGERFISRAFMRSISEPWLTGIGYQIRLWKYTLQVGWCWQLSFDTEEDGVLNAMEGRYMEDDAKKIGNWK